MKCTANKEICDVWGICDHSRTHQRDGFCLSPCRQGHSCQPVKPDLYICSRPCIGPNFPYAPSSPCSHRTAHQHNHCCDETGGKCLVCKKITEEGDIVLPEKKFFMLKVEGKGNPTVEHPHRHHATQAKPDLYICESQACRHTGDPCYHKTAHIRTDGCSSFAFNTCGGPCKKITEEGDIVLPEKKFFMLKVAGKGPPTMEHPYRHHAMQEAARLAQQPANIGRKVYMLETVAICEVKPGPIVWKTI